MFQTRVKGLDVLIGGGIRWGSSVTLASDLNDRIVLCHQIVRNALERDFIVYYQCFKEAPERIRFQMEDLNIDYERFEKERALKFFTPLETELTRDLKESSELLKKFGINSAVVRKIHPISLIQVEGFGEYPAIEIVEKLGAKDQYDSKAEEATKLLYKKEFHEGVLKEIYGKYAKKNVSQIKDDLILDFKSKGIADSMFDLPQNVTCRCQNVANPIPCIVKILEDQWFLKYSDKEWKRITKDALRKATIYPSSAIQWFINVIDWLKEWACARKTGLGTLLPWSQDWMVETLSDSTIYMAFYTINRYLKKHDIKPLQLSRQFFDFVFFNKGNVDRIAKLSKIKKEILHSMQNEFTYWYPVDLRNSGKDLVPNHLTFFLFHHAALFPEKYLPKAIGVNGYLMIQGKPMSKSKGNFITLRNAINKFGADATRCTLLLASEDMDDPDWRDESINDISSKLRSFYNLALNIIKTEPTKEFKHLEEWLVSRLQQKIKKTTESLEMMKTRTALENVFFEVWNDLRWYMRRKEKFNSKTLKNVLETWILLLAPFAPHICEEIWNKMGNREFISTSNWPTFNESKVSIEAEENEILIEKALEDTLNILRATKMKQKRIFYYTASKWKWNIYIEALKESLQERIKTQKFMKKLMRDPNVKKNTKEVVMYINAMVKEINGMSKDKKQKQISIKTVNESNILNEAKNFFEREFNAKISVYNEDDQKIYDPKNKASFARPYRPAIFIE